MSTAIELEIIKQKLIDSNDGSPSFKISEESLLSLDIVELVYKFSQYKTPMELIQALNQGDVVLNLKFNELENPRWTPNNSKGYSEDSNVSSKSKVDCTNWDTILTTFQKQAEIEEADSGHWYLKVGFPVLRGYWKDGDQTTIFNAPLFFAPVNIRYTSIEDAILTIKGRAFDINPSIATVASIKKKMLFDTLLFGPTEEIQIENIIEGYLRIGISFDTSSLNMPFDRCMFGNDQQLLKSVQEYNLESILFPAITLGLYDIYSNSIFWDFNKILQIDSDGLGKLLEPKTNLMFNYKKFSDDFRTNDIYLFSMIDIVQQLCVGRALSGNTLIQGPPGTGKSETICNILVNIALNNKTALVTSSKKTALDVLVSRLGDFSPIACHMVSKRKEVEYFYQQFGKLYKRFIDIRSNMEDEAIEQVVNRTTSEKLFEDTFNDYDISNKLFNTKVIFRDKEYLIKELISYANIEDVSLLEQNNIKEREDAIEFSVNYGAQFDDNQPTVSVSSVLKSFKDFTQQINPSLKVDVGYIQSLYEFLKGYDGFDKRIVAAAYILNNASIDFKEYDLLINAVEAPNPDYSAFTSKQANWINAVKSFDFFFLLDVLDQFDEVVAMAGQKFQVGTDLRLFATWYIFINPDIKSYLKEFAIKETKIESKTDMYLTRIEASVNETKLLLNRLIFLKFIDTVKKYGNELSNIMRQSTAYNPKPSAAVIKTNFDLIRNLFSIHICAIDDISNLIPCENGLYDYYVCDEASQVELEKALPSMYRGKKYVISGDTKQLQPTSVFKQKVEIKTSVNQKSKYAQDLGDAIKAVSIMQYYESRASTNVMLNYHYRSTYAELIDFSNQVFYEKNLKLVSKSTPYENPIIIHKVKGFWKNSCNLEEANAVYERIYELSNTADYEKSLGVITFNATQQAIIQEKILKSTSPKIKEWMERKSSNGSNIGIFVQNIENVQGDERDIILFSIGYDRTVSNYGTLSTQPSGANRINVAITRAKDKLEIFQSEEANMYKGTSSTARGPKVLTSWIRWANNMSKMCANKKVDSSTIPHFVSLVDEQIFHYLRSMLPEEYHIIYNQMQGTFFVNFTIFKNVTPVAAIFTQRDNWKTHGKFREEYIYRKLFLKNRKWLSLDISQLAWQIDESYKDDINKFLEKVMLFNDEIQIDLSSINKNSASVDVGEDMDEAVPANEENSLEPKE